MEHYAAVAPCPGFAAVCLIADKPIVNAQPIVGERLTVKQMPEAVGEFVVTFVVDGY